MHIIESAKNPWVRELCRLHQAKHRRLSRKFLIEGAHLLQEALLAGWPLEIVIATQEWWQRNCKEFADGIGKTRVQMVTTSVMSHLSTTESPDGVIAVALEPNQRPITPSEGSSLRIALDAVQDPGNLGALIRSAVASGCGTIYASPDTVDATNPKVLRSSAGQWFHNVPIVTDLSTQLMECRKDGFKILAACAGGTNFWKHDLRSPTLVLLGNEGSGLRSSLIDAADDTISVPMLNRVESLNVAMTGTLIMYEASRQRGDHS